MPRDREYRWGIQTKLSLASGLLVLLSLATFAWYSYSVTTETLEEQMGERLASHAKMAADTLADTMSATKLLSEIPTPGSRVHGILRDKLSELKKSANLDEETATNLDNIVLIGPKNHIWADANDELPVGETYWLISADSEEVSRAWKGNVEKSPLYPVGKDKRPYKSAYAPVKAEDGKIFAILRVNASAKFLLESTDKVRLALLLSALIITLIAALVGIWIARSIVIPIKDLVRASQKIAGGALDTEVFIESRDEIGFFAKTFNQMTRNLRDLYEEVEERSRQISELSASVAHEVRSPISAIQGFTELLEDDMEEEDPGLEYIEDIKMEVKILNAKVTDFMDFARPLEIEALPLDIVDVLESALAPMEKEAIDSNVGIVTKFNSALPAIYGDFDRLRGVFINLIRNSIQAMENGGGLIVGANLANENIEELDGNGKFVEIWVEDTGCGLDPGVLEHAFEPFFTTKGSGTGLGLAIVKKILDVHRGRIKPESEVGQGTIMRVFLPIDPPIDPNA